MIAALRTFIGTNQMMAYLVMMAERLVELHRVLRPTGSLYLHCDPTASHYLKIVLDTVFGVENFRNEIIWERSQPKGLASRKLPQNHDVILSYQKTSQAKWNKSASFKTYDLDDLPESIAQQYNKTDKTGRRFRYSSLTNPNPDRPNLTYEFLGVTRVWRWTKERMQKAYDEGIVVQTSPGSVPQQIRWLDEQQGMPISDVWTDIPFISPQSAERLGYPTQKPLALLERIIEVSSNEGDWVLDPFCGCGTTVAAAQKLGRQWIGIDVTHLSIALQKYRLKDMFGDDVAYQVIGEPESLEGARQLATEDRFQFQWWALSLMKARPYGGEAGSKKGKKGADGGIDGVITFIDDSSSKPKRVLVQVKSGKVSRPMISELVGTVQRENAEIGVFLTLEEPTREMVKEAVSAGFYDSPWSGQHRRIQILTVRELLAGGKVDMPPTGVTFRAAERVREEGAQQKGLFD
jgi:site-specific DNA-methyltransferase (adenine-specific)